MIILSMMHSHMGTLWDRLWAYTGYPSLTDTGIR
jgi:hypothetical protein